METLTNALLAVGLGSYSGRFIFASVAGFAGQLLVKPSVSYTKEGRMRPFYFLADEKNKKDSTFVPWWSWSLLPGLFAVLFI